MKTKSIAAVITALALSVCLTMAFAPAAFAADSAILSAGSAKLTAQSTASKATPKPKTPSKVKLVSKKARQVKLTWKASKVKGLKKQTYTVRWAYTDSLLSEVDGKTVKAKSLTLSNLSSACTLYVQVRTNAKYGNKTVHSEWSAVKSVEVKSAPLVNGTPEDWFIPDVSLSIVGNVNKKKASNLNAVLVECNSGTRWNGGYYFIRYSYNKSMKNAKTKMISSDTDSCDGASSFTLEGLKKGKMLYVQAQHCSPRSGSLTGSNFNSDWSEVESIRIPSKWVKEKGHWEPVYTTVVDKESYYEEIPPVWEAEDGTTLTGVDEKNAYVKAHPKEVYPTLVSGPSSIWHPAVTHQEQTGKSWVVDVPAHWE